MGLSYGWQKFQGAIHSLVADRSLKERLNYAIAYNLNVLEADEDLPKEIVEDFKEFIALVTRVEAVGEEGTIAATLNTLSDEDLGQLATKIVSMHDTVCRAYGKSRND